MALDAIRQALPAFRDAVEQGSGDFTSARSMLSKLKVRRRGDGASSHPGGRVHAVRSGSSSHRASPTRLRSC